MNFILQGIARYGTWIILLLGLLVAAFLLWNGLALASQKNRIEEAVNRRNKIYILNNNLKDVEEIDDETAAITPDTIRKYETSFYNICSWHEMLVQIIPIFPLLGILGTVAGLILEMQSGDMAGMISSLDVALETTLWGLIFSIVLKGIDAVFPSRIIYDAEVLLDDHYKKLSIAELFRDSQDK